MTGHTVCGEVTELLLTASEALVNQPNANILPISGDHDRGSDVGPAVFTLVVDWSIVSTWRQDTLMLDSLI